MKTARAAVGLLFILLTPARAGDNGPVAAVADPAWRVLEPGVEYRTFGAGYPTLHVVRVDPAVARIRCLSASSEESRRTAADWCREAKLAVAINAGMFGTDGLTHVGYLHSEGHVNNHRWNSYRSVLCLYPRGQELAIVRWIDLAPGADASGVAANYETVIQNLRLIRSPGKNVWPPSPRKWSEATVAIDLKGRILFLFSRAPHSMSDFNQTILSLPLGIRQAMHVEGGPEASLSIHAGGLDLDLCGSYETGFLEDASNVRQWAIPNVLGVSSDQSSSLRSGTTRPAE